MRLFYQPFPIRDALRHELSWTHYRALLRLEDSAARTWYMNESADQNWSTRALDRQIGSPPASPQWQRNSIQYTYAPVLPFKGEQAMNDRVSKEEEIQELTDRVFLLRQQLEAGKIHFAAHLVEDFRRSYEAIRLRGDGLVDPTTVDGRIRAATLAIRAMKHRDEAKKAISLGDIQEAYFTLIYQQFGWIFDRMTKAKATPSQASRAMMNDQGFITQMKSGLPELAKDLKEFWENVGDPGAYHLQDGAQLKATFAGDLFPAHWENAVSTAGLYIDTIVLPCPIMRIAPLLGIIPDNEVARLLVKHTLTAMTYREVATANLTPPIALILPNPEDFDRDTRKHLVSRAEPAMLKHGIRTAAYPSTMLSLLLTANRWPNQLAPRRVDNTYRKLMMPA